MTKIVMKFGGTSVADTQTMKNAVSKISVEVKKDNRVIVVVSAMGSTTDNLVKKIKEVSTIYDAREYDAILSTGETISSCLMALLLQKEGINARSWQGWQIPINTTDNHSNARILSINTKKIEEKFAEAAPKPMLYRPKATYVGKYEGPQGCNYIPIEDRK